MTCREFRDVLIYLAFGDLPPGQRGRAEDHLKACAACATEWHDYQVVVELARQLPEAPLPPHLEVRLRPLLLALRAAGPGAQPGP